MANKWDRITTKPGIIGILLVVLPAAKFVWTLIAAAANVQFLVNSGSWFWTQMDKGVVQLPIFGIGVILVLWALLRKESTTAVAPAKNDLKGAAEFYLNREAKLARFDAL